MLSVKECCCGCSLRTGSLILLWLSLISESISVLFRFVAFMLIKRMAKPAYAYAQSSLKYHEEVNTAAEGVTIFIFFLLILSGIGVILSLCGLIGIYKNAPKYLTFAVYYFGYQVGYYILLIFMLICMPVVASKFTPGPSGSNTDIVAFYVMFYLFVLALTSYFFIVVKSYRDAMKKGIANRGTNNKTLDANALVYHYTA